MSHTATRPMTVDEFVDWAMARPEIEHYELEGGEVVGMASERLAHARLKSRVWRFLSDAVESGSLPCEAVIDGLVVRVDANTGYEPDVVVLWRKDEDGATVIVDDPIIVVEVTSPSTRSRDHGPKLAGYRGVPSIRHYLIVDIDDQTVTHHRIDTTGALGTQIVCHEAILLDPPGIVLPPVFT